jgi:mannosyltransferase OCH1-like enzyme
MRVFGLAMSAPAPPAARRPRSRAIARTIHQTYRTDDVPAAFAAGVARLRSHNPGWTYRYWSDRDVHDFIDDVYGWAVLSLYLRINPRYGAARADLFRYLCIYHYGGVYLDIKSGGAVVLDRLIMPEDSYILSQWNNAGSRRFRNWGLHPELAHIKGGEFQQWHVIAAAGHPFLERVIDAVLGNIAAYAEGRDGTGRMAVLRTTGPIAYTRAIHAMLSTYPHRFVDVEAAGLRYCATRDHLSVFGASSYMRQTTSLVL